MTREVRTRKRAPVDELSQVVLHQLAEIEWNALMISMVRRLWLPGVAN